MAEFGPSVTEAPQTPNAVTPQVASVEEPVGVQAARAIFGGYREIKDKQRKSKQELFLSDFTNKQLSLIQATEQGGRSSIAARSEMTANLMAAIHANPSLRKELMEAHRNAIGSDIGGVLKGTKKEIMKEKLDQSLVEKGLINPDASESEFDRARNNWIIAQEADRRFEDEMKDIRYQKARTDLTASQISLLDKREARAAEDFLVAKTPALMDQFKTRSEELLGLIGKEGYDEAAVVRLIEEEWNAFENTVSVHMAQVDSHTAQSIIKNIENYKDIVLRRAKGEYTQKAFESEINQIRNFNQVMILRSSPKLAKAHALGELGFKDLLLNQKLQIAEEMAGILNQNGGYDPDVDKDVPASLFNDTPEGRKAINSYFKVIGVNPKNLTPEQRKEQETHLNNVLKSNKTYSAVMEDNPEKAVGLVTWMASKEFLNLIKEYPEVIKNNETAMRLLQANYGDEVYEMVDREFTSNNIIQFSPGTSALDVNSEEKPTPDGVSFRSSSQGVEFFATSDDKEFVRKAKELNQKLAPVINKNVQAFAHINGRSDYGKYWEEVYEKNMAGGKPDDKKGGNIDLSDFSDFAKALEKLPSTSKPAGAVVDAGAGYTVVKLDDGTTERRTGTRAWRNNNPGNIEYGRFAKSQGAIGSDGRFAVFKTYEEGRKAKEALLFESKSYRTKTIAEAIARYAPAFENNTNAYASNIAAAAGVSVDTPLSSLSASQRKKLLDAMERVEGFKKGKVTIQ